MYVWINGIRDKMKPYLESDFLVRGALEFKYPKV